LRTLLSVREVAAYLAVSTKTVYALCARGKLRHIRVLNAIRVAPEDLEACRMPFEAEMLRTAGPARPTQDGGVERRLKHLSIEDVGAGDDGGERHAVGVGEDVPFHSALAAIGRVAARQVPPFGAFTIAVSSAAHFHWMARFLS
jgi:excisionase family DNA binding protein